MKVSRVFAIVLAALYFVLLSCSTPTEPLDSELSSLTISIGDQINARTLLPAIDMAPVLFTITGTGPGASTFSMTTTGNPVSQEKLAVGLWSILVQATNANGTVIGTGVGSATVVNGVTTPVNIVVSTISGTGVLTLAALWPEGAVPVPTIVATLTPASGSAGPQELSFVISGNGATYSNQALTNGYYTLTFTLSSNGILVAGAAETVRIVTGQTTAGTYGFANVNTPGGVLSVTVTPNFFNPLEVSITGAGTYQAVGRTQLLTAATSNSPPTAGAGLSYRWYVNGASKGSGPTLTFGTGALPGYYRVDLTAFTSTGSRSGSATSSINVVSSVPSVLSVTPADLSKGISSNTEVSATFSEAMETKTLNNTSFTLRQGTALVAGTVGVQGNTVTFRPTSALAPSSLFTATLSTAAKALTGVPLPLTKTWSFTTVNPAMVSLGTAGGFTILTRSGLSVGAAGKVFGDVGLTAAGSAGFTGLGLTSDSSLAFSTSALLTGKAFDTQGTGGTPALLASAAMAADAATAEALGRTPPNNTNVGSGELGGANFVPGLYNWTTAASITTDMSLEGGASDVWVFQVAGALVQAASTSVRLSAGASAANVFWQVSGATSLGAGATFVGNVLSAGVILVGAGAQVTGHLYSQSSVGIGAGAQVSPPDYVGDTPANGRPLNVASRVL